MDSTVTAVYLRLAAPLQSWAGLRAAGNITSTAAHPTHSGLSGLLGACLGAPHGEIPEWIQKLSYRIRVDTPGTVIDEFQTVGVRDEAREFQQRIHWAVTGKAIKETTVNLTPDAQKGTAIIRRTLLSGAEFLVEIQAEEYHQKLYDALRNPIYSPYLGKKAFAPTFPLLLGAGPKGELAQLPHCPESKPRWYQAKKSGDSQQSVNLRIGTLSQGETINWETGVSVYVAKDRQDWLTKVREKLPQK